MGYYVNPTDGKTKEQWLIIHGAKCGVSETRLLRDALEAKTTPLIPVCLVDNGWMTAAGIAYDDRELDVFLRDDGRPKTWYLVPRDKLKPFCSEL